MLLRAVLNFAMYFNSRFVSCTLMLQLRLVALNNQRNLFRLSNDMCPKLASPFPTFPNLPHSFWLPT